MVHRIDTPTAVAEIPATGAAGAPGFWIDGNAITGQAATKASQDFFNMLQEEPIAVLALGGVAPIKGVYNQMATVIAALIQQGYGTFATETGASAVNAYVVAPAPAMAAMPPNGTVLRVLIGTGPNTQAAKLNCGFGPVSILHSDGNALRFNEVAYGLNAFVSYNGAWRVMAPPRTVIQAALNLYVSPAGNDANDGLTGATALATPFGASALLRTAYDTNGYQITVNVAAGTYADTAVGFSGPLVGQVSAAALLFTGPPAAILEGPGNIFVAAEGGGFKVSGFTLAGASDLYATLGGVIRFQGNIFDACTVNGHMQASDGANLVCDGAYTAAGGGPAHILCSGGGTFGVGAAAAFEATVTGNPNFTTGFAVATGAGRILIPPALMTFSGAATGESCVLTTLGLIDVAGVGAAFFPGNGASTNDGSGILH